MRRSIGLSIYLLIARWTSAAMARRITRRTQDPKTLKERLGRPMLPRPKGPLIWFHLSSDAEAEAVLELIRRMRDERDELNFLLTTSRIVSIAWLYDRMPEGVVLQRAPADHPDFVEGFLDHWVPDVGVFTEAELRAALIASASERNVPLFFVDANLHGRQRSGWRLMPGLARDILRRFERILVADEDTTRWLRRMGAQTWKMEEIGMLEEGTVALSCDEAERDRIAALLATRPVWLAAFADSREIAMVTEAHRAAMRRSHRLLLILVPANRADGLAVHKQLESEGWHVACRSQDHDPDESIQILIGDLVGEMGLWYRLAPVSFMGSSIGQGGGRNPFEPAALGSAILHGPNVGAYSASYKRLEEAGATRLVPNAKALGEAVEELLAPDRAAEMAQAAWMVCSAGAEVTDRVKDLLFDSIDERGLA